MKPCSTCRVSALCLALGHKACLDRLIMTRVKREIRDSIHTGLPYQSWTEHTLNARAAINATLIPEDCPCKP